MISKGVQNTGGFLPLTCPQQTMSKETGGICPDSLRFISRDCQIMSTQLNGILTPFGPLRLKLTVSEDGKTACLDVEPLSYSTCEKIVVHTGAWASTESRSTFAIDPSIANHKIIKIQPLD